jgi:hypothetical protein
MKSKLALLALMGVLALSASAPSAMASTVGNHAAARPNATSRPNARAVSKKVGPTARQVNPNARPSGHSVK